MLEISHGGGLRRAEDVEVQPPCWYGHEFTSTLRMVCLGGRDRQAGTHSCTRTPALLQSVVQASFLSRTHTHSRTLAYSRCRTQRSTCRVTVEREGHWEMFLATCRASILRAASTSSSWAAHVCVGGVGDLGGGLRPKDERAKGKHRNLSWAHTLAASHTPSIYLRQ